MTRNVPIDFEGKGWHQGPVERVHIMIHGRVQGVFFRANAQKEALRLGLVGWVRNTPDGAVEALAEGKRAALEAFVTWCNRGPTHASVQRVNAAWEVAKNDLSGFHIRY